MFVRSHNQGGDGGDADMAEVHGFSRSEFFCCSRGGSEFVLAGSGCRTQMAQLAGTVSHFLQPASSSPAPRKRGLQSSGPPAETRVPHKRSIL